MSRSTRFLTPSPVSSVYNSDEGGIDTVEGLSHSQIINFFNKHFGLEMGVNVLTFVIIFFITNGKTKYLGDNMQGFAANQLQNKDKDKLQELLREGGDLHEEVLTTKNDSDLLRDCFFYKGWTDKEENIKTLNELKNFFKEEGSEFDLENIAKKVKRVFMYQLNSVRIVRSIGYFVFKTADRCGDQGMSTASVEKHRKHRIEFMSDQFKVAKEHSFISYVVEEVMKTRRSWCDNPVLIFSDYDKKKIIDFYRNNDTWKMDMAKFKFIMELVVAAGTFISLLINLATFISSKYAAFSGITLPTAATASTAAVVAAKAVVVLFFVVSLVILYRKCQMVFAQRLADKNLKDIEYTFYILISGSDKEIDEAYSDSKGETMKIAAAAGKAATELLRGSQRRMTAPPDSDDEGDETQGGGSTPRQSSLGIHDSARRPLGRIIIDMHRRERERAKSHGDSTTLKSPRLSPASSRGSSSRSPSLAASSSPRLALSPDSSHVPSTQSESDPSTRATRLWGMVRTDNDRKKRIERHMNEIIQLVTIQSRMTKDAKNLDDSIEEISKHKLKVMLYALFNKIATTIVAFLGSKDSLGINIEGLAIDISPEQMANISQISAGVNIGLALLKIIYEIFTRFRAKRKLETGTVYDENIYKKINNDTTVREGGGEDNNDVVDAELKRVLKLPKKDEEFLLKLLKTISLEDLLSQIYKDYMHGKEGKKNTMEKLLSVVRRMAMVMIKNFNLDISSSAAKKLLDLMDKFKRKKVISIREFSELYFAGLPDEIRKKLQDAKETANRTLKRTMSKISRTRRRGGGGRKNKRYKSRRYTRKYTKKKKYNTNNRKNTKKRTKR